MKKRVNIILIFFILLFACKKEVNEETPITKETGKIKFKFTHILDGLPLQKDSIMYLNAAGNSYGIFDLMYFISNVKLYKSDGSIKLINEWKDINYVDVDIPYTLTWDVYDEIPAGEYDSITFVFGIPTEKNKSFMFVNYPEVNMMWPDVLGGGYHYMMINGKWKDSSGIANNFDFHLGIGQLYHSNATDCIDSIYAFVQNYFTVSLPGSSFTLLKSETKEIEIVMNIESWFKTPHNFDFNYWGANIMQLQPAMQVVKENGYDVFTIGKINKEYK